LHSIAEIDLIDGAASTLQWALEIKLYHGISCEADHRHPHTSVEH
jgi:hypothetical protein